jgi:hypothetical protein
MSERQSFAGRLALTVLVGGSTFFSGALAASAAGTAPNTIISNTSSATYQDANSQTYGTNSNTVSVIVQNAPSMTVTGGSNKTIAPGQTVTDAFTITNTGNAAGIVAFTAGANSGVTGGSDSGSATVSYWYNATSYSDIASLNTALAGAPVAVGNSAVVGVVYTLAANAAAPGSVQTNLYGTITYAVVGSAPAQTSSAVGAASAESDSVTADARLDVALSASQNGSTGAVTYTLGAADGTATWGAKDSIAVKTLLGASASGVFISAKIPQFGGSPLTINGNAATSTSSTYGFATGATATIYYTTSASGSSGWTVAPSGAVSAGAQYIGAFISGGTCTINGASTSGIEICPISGPTSSAGSVTNPAISLTFTVNAPTGSGSANSGSMATIGNSVIGDNASTEHVIAPGIALNTLADGTGDTTALTTAGAGVNNTTAINSPSGASTASANQSLAQYLVENGPFAAAAATGSFDGSSSDDNHDFTAVSFVSTNITYTTTNTTASYSPTTATATATAVANIKVESTVANTGNKADSYNIVATAPSGWTVFLESDAASAPGGSFGGSAAGATSTAANVALASGATLNYWAVYTAPSGVIYLSHGLGTVVATSTADGTVKNTTNDLLYAGFIALTTSAATTPGCPAGVTPTVGSVCPGGTISYTIDYRNIVGGSSNYDTSSVPAVSFAGVTTKAGSLVITADGTNGTSLGNNWATYSAGPTAIPVDSTDNTTFTYWSGSTGGTSAGSFQAGLTKFIATVGGASFQLVPYGFAAGTGSKGTITFSVTVN